ncbi:MULTISPECIES: hypothetical protein [Shewanella]|jgi:hypothetical protein|uniref:hypothetical protein n=1 Tax=Shewanella TaxID=22 RepID=UPI00317AC646
MLVKIHNSKNEELTSLLDELVASELASVKHAVADSITTYNVSDELCESVLDDLTETLMSKGLDSDGNVNSVGLDIERYIDLFNQ